MQTSWCTHAYNYVYIFWILWCFGQLSSLSRHAEDLFGEMIADSTAIMNRTISLQGRVDKLAVKVKNLDSNVEEGNQQTFYSVWNIGMCL